MNYDLILLQGRTVGLGKKRQRSLSHSGDLKRRGPKPKIKSVPGPAIGMVCSIVSVQQIQIYLCSSLPILIKLFTTEV